MTNPAEQTYVFTVKAVGEAIKNLVTNPIHEHFAGYLAVLRAQRANGGREARLQDITEFHDRYLRVLDAPPTSPYIRPFKSRGKGLELFNPNVAGSYASSSLRAKGKLISVLDVRGSRQSATYDLHDNHAAAVLDVLLRGHKVPAISLAAFLYRDYGFILEQPQIIRVLNIFRDEFGLRAEQPSEQATFNTVFADDGPDFRDSDLQAREPSDG